MRVFTFTEAGGHPANEDAFRVVPHPQHPDMLLVALADGQGGRIGGRWAAWVAVEAAIEAAGRIQPMELLSNPFAWPGLLRKADEAVRDDPDAGFTTLIAFAALGPDGPVCGAASGDSALLMVDADGPEVWTERQHKNPPVGTGEAVFSPMTGWPSHPWIMLAMTDGVWKYAGWEPSRRPPDRTGARR